MEGDFYAVDEEEFVEIQMELEVVSFACVPVMEIRSVVVHQIGNRQHLAITIDAVTNVVGSCYQRECRRHPYRLCANKGEREGKVQRGHRVGVFMNLYGKSVGSVHEQQRRK